MICEVFVFAALYFFAILLSGNVCRRRFSKARHKRYMASGSSPRALQIFFLHK